MATLAAAPPLPHQRSWRARTRRPFITIPPPPARAQIAAIVRRMRDEWQGPEYDLLSRNCWCAFRVCFACCGLHQGQHRCSQMAQPPPQTPPHTHTSRRSHFCDVLASQLGVAPVPGWLNRFAETGAAAMQATNDASNTVRFLWDGGGGWAPPQCRRRATR